MDNVQHARGDVEDAMRRLLEAVSQIQRQNALALRETSYDAALLRACTQLARP
jgi:hypothetical protein